MLIRWLLKWAPFKIDALGLVTLLGADELNRAIGRLSKSQMTEYLPLVGGFVIASDSIRSHIAGFTLYNVTDGICATDITGWFARWLLFRDLTYNSTTLTITVLQRYNHLDEGEYSAVWYGTAAFSVLIILPIFMADWWALANAISLGISVVVRTAILQANRDAVDRSVEKGLQQSGTIVKTLWKLPNGHSVTIYVARGIVTDCLLTTPRPNNADLYFAFRILGWVAFLIHAISLGMASLPNQLITIVVLAVSTVCAVAGVACSEERVGSRILIRRLDDQGPNNSMAAAFARLKLTPDEEESMVAWRLMPHPTNELWWRKYRDCLAQNALNAFNTWKEKHTWVSYENQLQAEANRQRAPQDATNPLPAANH